MGYQASVFLDLYQWTARGFQWSMLLRLQGMLPGYQQVRCCYIITLETFTIHCAIVCSCHIGSTVSMIASYHTDTSSDGKCKSPMSTSLIVRISSSIIVIDIAICSTLSAVSTAVANFVSSAHTSLGTHKEPDMASYSVPTCQHEHQL